MVVKTDFPSSIVKLISLRSSKLTNHDQKMGEVYTIFVNCYSLKWSDEGDFVEVSVPNYGEKIPKTRKTISAEFRADLKKASWTDLAIKTLEEQVLFPKDGIWHNCRRINPRSGKITRPRC